MPILQEQKSVMYKDVLYADFAGAKIGYVQGCTVCRFCIVTGT